MPVRAEGRKRWAQDSSAQSNVLFSGGLAQSRNAQVSQAQSVNGNRGGKERCRTWPRFPSVPLARPYISVLGPIQHSSITRATPTFQSFHKNVMGGEMDVFSIQGVMSRYTQCNTIVGAHTVSTILKIIL